MGREERPTGLTKDTGWQIGVRKTLPIQHAEAWRLLTSARGLRIWLDPVSEMDFTRGATYRLEDGTVGEVRVFVPNSHLRITWQPAGWGRASTIQLRVIPKGDKTVIAFHHGAPSRCGGAGKASHALQSGACGA
ncbi:MAG: SRPBCC domain-containing protein [Anaerolineae bacterium]